MLETPVGPIFESNSIACFGKTINFPPSPVNFGHPSKIVMLELMGFLSVAVITYLKGSNPLYASSHIVCARCLVLLIVLSLSACMCVMILYCFVRLNFLFHIEYWIDFPSLEIDPNILAWCKPRIECAKYLPLVSYILFHYKIVLLLFKASK